TTQDGGDWSLFREPCERMRDRSEDVELHRPPGRLVGLVESGFDNDCARVKVDLPHAGLDQGEQQAAVELEDVVGDARLDPLDPPKLVPVGALDREADELEDVVLPGPGRRQGAPVDLEGRAARWLAVEPDHGPSAGALG